MPQPKSPPKSIRAPADVWEAIAALVPDHAKTFNAAAVEAMRVGAASIKGGAGVTPQPKPKRRGKAEKVKPDLEALKAAGAVAPASTLPRDEEPPRHKLDTSMVPVNPPRAPMQKTPGRWKIK